MTVTTDVAIIGAGPAGSTAAALLAKRGVDVTLIDRDQFPRDKLCGEFLSYDALPFLELIDATSELDTLGASLIRRCRVITPSRTIEFEFPAPARGVSRLALDAMLLGRAGAYGARIMTGCAATQIATTQEGHTIEIDREATPDVLHAKVVVGAWGRWGRLDHQLGRSFVKKHRGRHFGFKRHYRSPASAQLETIDLHSFEGGYLGVSRIESGITNICGLVHEARLKGLRGGWNAFVERIRGENHELDALYRDQKPVQDDFLSSEPVIFRARSAYEGGILLAGDAAGIIDPLTGNGMAMGVQSALIASMAALRMLKENDRDRAGLRYQREHEALFLRRLRWSRTTAALLSRRHLLNLTSRLTSASKLARLLADKTRATQESVDGAIRSWKDSLE